MGGEVEEGGEFGVGFFEPDIGAEGFDERGDLVAMVPLKGTTAGGKTYTLREGAVVTVKMDGVVIGSATMGAAASSGSGH
jgi:hypothetical protein